MSNLACTRCDNPSTTPYLPHPEAKFYAPGDICAILENTSTPVYLLLTGKPPPSRTASATNLSWGTARFAQWVRRTKAKNPASTNGTLTSVTSTELTTALPARPALIMERIPIAVNGPRKLPRVLKHFSIPISPHPLALPQFTHYHSTPRWPKGDTWLIALPFESEAEYLQRRWTDKTVPGGSYRLDEDDLAQLSHICNTRRTQWDDLCARDPGLRERSLLHYQAHVTKAINKKKRESQGGQKARRHSDALLPFSPISGGKQSTDIDVRAPGPSRPVVAGMPDACAKEDTTQRVKEGAPSIGSASSKARSILGIGEPILRAAKKLVPSSRPNERK
ncbi:hypothetical protein NUW54_g7205 [Trametes sanguinea]|uniref:Uncharacterized protein n=1 Tax=Trametes sanguinea TaxID=158606 RepID=A0ACC1PP00_9APHY|nr:hypothetical protein NUW54_g7205 [Trametes sanguinea]